MDPLCIYKYLQAVAGFEQFNQSSNYFCQRLESLSTSDFEYSILGISRSLYPFNNNNIVICLHFCRSCFLLLYWHQPSTNECCSLIPSRSITTML